MSEKLTHKVGIFVWINAESPDDALDYTRDVLRRLDGVADIVRCEVVNVAAPGDLGYTDA